MIRRQQYQLEMLSCLEAFRGLCLLQEISDEGPLIRRRPFAPAEWI